MYLKKKVWPPNPLFPLSQKQLKYDALKTGKKLTDGDIASDFTLHTHHCTSSYFNTAQI